MGIGEYLAAGYSERAICRELGISKGAVWRYKRRERKAGRLSGVPRSNILYIADKSKEEREMCAHVREESEQDAVIGAWVKYRGRVLIEEEVAEMARWRAQLGEERLIELIGAAWRRCTADRMSFGYFADYYVEPALRGAQKAGRGNGATVRKHKASAAPVKVTTTTKPAERRKENDKGRHEDAAEKVAGGIRKPIGTEVEPDGSDGDIGGGGGKSPMPGMRRVAVSEKEESGKDAVREPRKREDIHFIEGLPLLPILGKF